jgi:hypothetical protein
VDKGGDETGGAEQTMSDQDMQDMRGLPGAARAFEPGAQAWDRQDGDVTFWTRTVGDLIAPTGRIVASDPFECADAPAFAREVPPGRYPVLVALAQFARSGGERIVAAMLRLRDAAPVRWEPAQWVRDADHAASASPETEQEKGGRQLAS